MILKRLPELTRMDLALMRLYIELNYLCSRLTLELNVTMRPEQDTLLFMLLLTSGRSTWSGTFSAREFV